MALFVQTDVSYHWVKRLSASTHGSGVLKITMHGDSDASEEQFNQAEVLVFTNDAAMVDRLVKSINGAAEDPMFAEVTEPADAS